MAATTPHAASAAGRSRDLLPPMTLIGFIVAVLAIALMGLFTYRLLLSRQVAAAKVTEGLNNLQTLEKTLSTLKDAETGQRGYLVTGEERYLEPYTTARGDLPGLMATLRQHLSGEGETPRLATLQRMVDDKMTELEQTIALRREGKTEEARAMVLTDRGRVAMDRARAEIADLESAERASLDARQAEWDAAVTLSSRVTWGGSAVLLFLVTAAVVMTSRDYQRRESETWIRASHAALGVETRGELRLDVLGERVLAFLARCIGAQAGALYVADPDGTLRLTAGYGLTPGSAPELVPPGEGLVGQAARGGRLIHVTQVPEGYLRVSSGLGRATPRELLIAPALSDGVTRAVIELGFLSPVQPPEQELLERVSDLVGVTVRSSRDRTRLEDLLTETQRQSEELQVQQEELRVNNEELEEQSRALRESQARLETQQAELEEINATLEEQSDALERQRDDLTASQAVLGEKAAELERSNQYKSEFLANMSHELRTPLNSSLILAKLLADNKTGNLTDEQVRFAQTISSAGNDLLTLINDILDLSKIEAGKIEMSVGPVGIRATVDALVTTFLPMAKDKGIAFRAELEPDAPERIETDAQRLSQILRNLLSNAVKFTDHGEVVVRVFRADADRIGFAVRDTGIGISHDQRDVIFEAFRQADGSTHRKYGGTGLGLSISRDLARLLGGDITVDSSPAQGSTFSLILPVTAPARTEALAPAPAAHALVPRPVPPRREARPSPPVPAASQTEVDADFATARRKILIVEDDPRFASILRDLGHEMGFRCIVAQTANEGVSAAVRYRPDAILLDVNLPDHSGLGVLDQLKHNPATRHIPVHVASVADFSHEALERGAVGYAVKPVNRDELIDAFRRLEAKFSQRLRRVLVVEDDARQRDSIRQLLQNDEVEITTVETAGEALAALRRTTFDCVVMDLNLPDVAGFELLETMASEEAVSFPPVIVYTGRSLSRDEEQQLRRFSRSIIIKDARSPERLLDEVTLFLHQVESTLPPDRQRMLQAVRDRDQTLDGRRLLIVEDDARNIFALSSVLEPKGAVLEIARNGLEALAALERSRAAGGRPIDLVLMDIMMPEMDGLTAMREIRRRPEWKKLPIIALTAKAMKDDQEKCLAAGANDYIAKPLDVEKLLSLVRVWIPR